MSMNRDLFRLSSLANVNVNVVGRANARRLLAGRPALHASAARRVVVAPASCFQCNMKKFNDCFASREDGSQGPRASTDACSALQGDEQCPTICPATWAHNSYFKRSDRDLGEVPTRTEGIPVRHEVAVLCRCDTSRSERKPGAYLSSQLPHSIRWPCWAPC